MKKRREKSLSPPTKNSSKNYCKKRFLVKFNKEDQAGAGHAMLTARARETRRERKKSHQLKV